MRVGPLWARPSHPRHRQSSRCEYLNASGNKDTLQANKIDIMIIQKYLTIFKLKLVQAMDMIEG